MRDHVEQTLTWFRDAVLSDDPFEMRPAGYWTVDAWFRDQDARSPEQSLGWWPLQLGTAMGRLVGGNLCTFNLLQRGLIGPRSRVRWSWWRTTS